MCARMLAFGNVFAQRACIVCLLKLHDFANLLHILHSILHIRVGDMGGAVYIRIYSISILGF